jgi:hypothetical protein
MMKNAETAKAFAPEQSGAGNITKPWTLLPKNA